MARLAWAMACTALLGIASVVLLGLVMVLLGGCAAASQAGPLEEGRDLYKQHCRQCHGETGTRVPAALLDNPSVLARGGDTALAQVIAEGKGVMPAFSTEHEGPLTSTQIAAIVEYLLSPDGLAAKAWPGRKIYLEHCAQCHGKKGMRIPAARLNKDFLEQRDDAVLRVVIQRGYRTMPALGKGFGGSLSEVDIEAVIRYLRMITGSTQPIDQGVSSARVMAPAEASSSHAEGGALAAGGELAARGAEIFQSQCSLCHGATGDEVPGLNLMDQGFLAERGDEALLTAIAQGKGEMPAMGKASGGSLSDDDVAAVLAYLKAQAGGGAPAAAATPAVDTTQALRSVPTDAAQLFQDNCAICHAELQLPRVDPTLVQTIISNGIAEKGMPAFGEKLTTEQIEALTRLIASGEAVGSGAEANPFAGVVRHVESWISKHPTFVKENGSQLCQKCHRLSFCANCHRGGTAR